MPAKLASNINDDFSMPREFFLTKMNKRDT